MPWNPEQYNKFHAQRSMPFEDLLNMVNVIPGLKAVDLGCGTGELTEILYDKLPESTVVGIDNSTQMLTLANLRNRPRLSFLFGDLAKLDGEWNLIFSNAALQWSENHQNLIKYLYSKLLNGGQIAIQIPSNHSHISHKLIIETAQEEPFRTIMDGFLRYSPVLSIEQYAQILFSLGAENITIYEKVYTHILNNSDEVVEWVSGTALVPYFERLGSYKNDFIQSLRNKFRDNMPESPIFYPFKRILFVAQKPGNYASR